MKKFIKFLLLVSFFSAPLLVSAKTFDKNLYFGVTNDSDVIMLQEFLTEQGIYSGPITGNFFSLTLAAVKKFQLNNAISPAAGYFGSITRTKANELLSVQVNASEQQAVLETGATTPAPTSPASTNSLMLSLQAQIAALLQQVTQIQQQQTQSQSIPQTTTQTQSTQTNTNPTTSTIRVYLNETSRTLTVGQTYQLTPTIVYPAGTPYSNFTWSSSDSTVASVSSGGLVTALKAGTATITVTTIVNGSGFSAYDVITVVPSQTQSTQTQTPTQNQISSLVADVIPPIISNVQATNIAPYSATITWMTNEDSNSTVYFGLSSGSYFSSTNGSISAMNSGHLHTVYLSSLTANKKYYYKVTSADNNNNKSTSNEYDFTTAPIPPGSVTVTKNPAVNVIVNMKPTTVASTRIGSYAITASLADNVIITSLTFQVANISYIHNVFVKVNGTQFGTTRGVVPGEGYSFIGTPFTILKGETVYVDVYADITSSTNDTTTTAITTMTNLAGNGATSLNAITLPSTVSGQDITIKITSQLTVISISAVTGIAANNHARSTADIMAAFDFTADPTNNLTIHAVTLSLAGTPAPGAVRLIDGDTGSDWGNSLPITWDSSLRDSITFYPNYILSAGATKKIKVQMDTINFVATSGSVNGTAAQWSINNGADATHNYNAVDWSVGSGNHYNISNLPIYGPAIHY